LRPAERFEVFRWNVCCTGVGDDVLCVSQTRGLKLMCNSLHCSLNQPMCRHGSEVCFVELPSFTRSPECESCYLASVV